MCVKKGISFIFSCCFIFNSYFVNSQNLFPKYEFGVGLSGFIYQGDLTPHRAGSYETLRLGLNLQGSIIINRSFSLRTNLAIGGLRGNDSLYNTPAFRKHRNFNFRTPVLEISELLLWNPLGTNYKEKSLSPYLFAGAGVTLLHIKRDYSNFDTAYFGDGTELLTLLALDANHAVPRVIPVIPVGVGVRYSVSPSIAISAETSYRFTFTDYLDGFSQAANPSKNDHYQTLTVSAIYRVGYKNKLNCPVLKY